MRILVVGAGATGGAFGARLAQAGRNVTFLVRQARAGQLRERGLHVTGANGDFSVTPRVVTKDELAEPYDLVLLGLKAYQLESAIADFAPAVGEHTGILPMLNGMRHLDVLADRFGAERVLGGVCIISSTIDESGRIVMLHPMQGLIYGEQSGERTARVTAIDAALQGAEFTTTLVNDIVRAMWEKWVFISSLAAATCLMRGTIAQIVTAGGADVNSAIYDECHAVMNAAGFESTGVIAGDVRARLTDPALPLSASMYRDMLAGSPVEADAILGDLLARASELGVPTPLVAAAYTQLNVYQRALRTA
jgi:2-dehydropantoate 2-reductase